MNIFYRILGDDERNDHVLRRDLAWWTCYQAPYSNGGEDENENELAQQQGTSNYLDNSSGATISVNQQSRVDDAPSGDILVIGFDRRGKFYASTLVDHSCPMYCTDLPRKGAENPTPPESGKTDELVVQGEDFLPTILIQHLFTQFVWAISKDLPKACLPLHFLDPATEVEIEGRDKLNLESIKETWTLPRLYHQKLSTLVSQIEGQGLGSRNDILFCIIPAFSFHDLLPNRAMLQFLPLVPKDDAWTTVTRQYHALLDTNMRTNKPEVLCYCIIIQIMEFLYIAGQPYDKAFRPEGKLNEELRKLVFTLSSPKSRHVLEMFEHMHDHQGREDAFYEIFQKLFERGPI
jgi:hypothetical protein